MEVLILSEGTLQARVRCRETRTDTTVTVCEPLTSIAVKVNDVLVMATLGCSIGVRGDDVVGGGYLGDGLTR